MVEYVISFLVPIALAQSGPAVVINEILYDALGADEGYEWVELKNNGSAPVEVAGWKLQSGGTSFGNTVTLPAGLTIDPGGYLLIGESSVPGAQFVANFTLQNGGNPTDGVRLLDAQGQVIDVVLYGEPNTNGLPDESGAPGTLPAAGAPPGASLARLPDGADSNVSGIDFAATSALTPGAANIAAAISTPTPTSPAEAAAKAGPSSSPAASVAGTISPPVTYPNTVVVNEFLPNSAGADATDEFIELKNLSSEAVDLSGWQLDDAPGGSSPYRIPSGVVLPAGGIRSFSSAETKIALNNNGDTVRLLDPSGQVQSQYNYETATKGHSYSRLANGSFVVTSLPTPGAANAVVAAVSAGPTGRPVAKAPSSAAASAPPAASPLPAGGAVAGTVANRPAPLAVIRVAPSAEPSYLHSESTASPQPAAPAVAAEQSPAASPASPVATLDRGGLWKVGGLLLAALVVFGLTSYKSWLPFMSSS